MTTEAALLHPLVQQALQRHQLSFEAMPCDPNLADTAAFCEHYQFSPEQTCNAILVASKTDPIKYACCVILATCKLDVNKKVCQLLDVKRCSFASGELTKELTGMEIGGVTPLGLPDDMPIFVDQAVFDNQRVVLGGGNRTSKLLLNPNGLLKVPGLHAVPQLGLPR
jgi:prolyl-tRNA editing enzyme YbaK/EbsC (Cys-tRNA(Pro) deacylase)